ncbi:MAG TPA: Helicase associated domain protein [Streptosporangiaceae bacterium]|jgi:superfamily II DNA or RNA helicase
MTGGAAARSLRAYQAEAVAAILAALGGGGRAQLRAACGTGKTLIASAVAGELARDGVAVALVPSLALAAQTITGWHEGSAAGRVLAVCSDHTVGSGVAGAADLPVPVTTDAEVIAKWLVNAPAGALVVGTYDSAHRLAEGLRRAGIVAELTVCDEAHRLAGLAGKATAAVLEPGVLPDRRRLFMTATPRICTGTSADGTLRTVSMDDEEVFGPVAYRYPFRRAISDGWLKDYRIVIATVTSRQVAALLEGNSELTGEKDVPVAMAVAQAALAMAAARFGLRRCVAFLPRVAQARRFSASLPATLAMLPASRRPPGALSAGHVHGRMSGLQRNLALDRLRTPPAGGWSVVANARCLGEGVDIPAIDSVLFGAPKESVTDIVQAVGRALRRHGDADTATIIAPALLPDAADGDGGTDAGPDAAGNRYESVLRVVRAMCAHDDDLTDALQAARARRSADPAAQPPELPSRITVLAPPGALQATLDALRIQVLTRTTSSWWEGYGAARARYDARGDLDVPMAYVAAGGFPLGAWLTAQRAARNRGELPPGRVALLDQAGMTWDRLETAWMAAYHELRAFKDEHGHFEVPGGHCTAGGIQLSEWQRTQRDAARTGKLTSQRTALLEEIGFSWDPAEARWMRRYHQLTEAITRHGGPASLPPGCPEATWLEGQHLAHHHGKLPAGKITLLEQAGIAIRRADPWTAAYQAAMAFKQEHGHLRIPAGYTGDAGIDLCDWLRDQRIRRKAGRITSEQERLLTDAGFTWDPAAEAWNARYQEAAAWKHEHGRLDLPRKHPVREWLYRQQKLRDTGRLPPGRAAALHELGALTGTPPGTTGKAP